MAGSNGNGNGRSIGTGVTTGNGKPPMLLVHGFTGTPVMWDPLLPYLEPHHDVAAIALPGHFGGPAFTDPGESIIETMLDAVELQMDELGWDKAHIVGNSLGGWISLLLAGRGRALSTVAISPAGGWELGSSEVTRAVAIFKRQELSLKFFYPLAQELVKRPRGRVIALWDAVGYPERLPGHLASQWLEASKGCSCRDLLIQFSGSVNAPDDLEIDGPVRIAWGTRDRILPYKRYAPRWKKILPQAEWVSLDKLGHVPMSDAPSLIAQTILEVSTAAGAAASTKD
ncbi:MAG: alpha/beta fold hydrolase [Solirubrobacterales bacterium]